MSKVEIPKKIRAEDFAPDERLMISKISSIYNDFTDSYYYHMTKSIDFNNLNQDFVTTSVIINSSGQVTNVPQIKYNLKNKPRGIVVVSATNMKNPNVYPINTPFVSWDITTQGNLRILNVTGLQNDSQYALSLLLIG